jgi:hypothetical protein
MMLASATERKVKRQPRRFPGIVHDSAVLGVERSHLYRVLAGKRTGVRLLAEYRQLKEAQRHPPTNETSQQQPERIP